MASFRRASKRRSRKRDLLETPSSWPNNLVSTYNRQPSSLYEGQLASPPASSGYAVPSSSLDVETCNHDVFEGPLKDGDEEKEEIEPRLSKSMVPSPVLEAELSVCSSPPQTLRQAAFEPSVDPKHLSLHEKVRLLKICCNHGYQFLHCPTSGKNAEEEVWTSIMEEFLTTVRPGFFTKYSDVKKVAKKTCRNRRKNTKGNVPPQRRSRMGDLDTWIDRWVRIWKCRDLVVNIANAHQSMRETIGENKLKRIFCQRMEGDELPQDLGGLTLSPPLWKAIQKQIRIEERSLGARHISLFPGQDESDWTDDETESDMMEEAGGEGLPIRSIEEEYQNSYPEALDVVVSTPYLEIEGELDFPDPSPRTQARLDQFERGYTTMLKEEQGRTGKQTSILDLAYKRQERGKRSPVSSESPSEPEEPLGDGTVRLLLGEKGLTNPTIHLSTSSPNEVGDEEYDRPTNLPTERSTPPPSEADVQRSSGTNPTRSQRLKSGTYCHGEEVLLGFHNRQVILAGMNDTAAQDYRQGVCAKIDISGRVRLRLRVQNMQGEQVPDEFCLSGASVYPKDVIYLPKFHDMSYDEVRQEVARQSLLPVNQRTYHDWVPTAMADKEENVSMPISNSQRKRLRKDVYVNHDAASMSANANSGEMERNETAALISQESDSQKSSRNSERDIGTIPNVSIPVETRRFALCELSAGYHSAKTVGGRPDLSNRKFKEADPSRTGTPDLLGQFLADEARKQRKPLAPHIIPHHSSPPRRLNPQGRISNKNRITPSRFYGVESLGHDMVDSSRQISGPREQPIILHQLKPGSNTNVKTPSVFLTQDYSDSDSLPDVEELHRRRVRAAKVTTSLQHTEHLQDSRDLSTSVADKVVSSLAPPYPQGSGHTKSAGTSLKATEDHQKLATDERQDQGSTAIKASGSCSKKRARCQSMTNSSSNSSGSFNPLTGPKALGDITSASNEYFAKRLRPPPPSGLVQTPVPPPDLTNYGLKPFWHPSIESVVRSNGVLDKEQGHLGDRSLDKVKGGAIQSYPQSHPQNKYSAPGPRPSNGNGYPPKGKTGAKNTRPLHRFHPYEQPGGSSGTTTSQSRRNNGGRGRRDRYKGKDRHGRINDGNYINHGLLREATTDTVDSQNFSVSRKVDILWSRMKELRRRIGKDD
ncbi:uncharacterized protein GGS22DRAFT_193357 [Annulohypoxylon maeteangense]|uniref:uncharacterized protein n=1 Tax=Annulohypoxylon maeteangense TaxID=1927788 RepID=UPI002007D70B|nr:uncharacterized protein GGS22DRAFT_193357 [Annulohypoxylon maeteangense]KAI0880297.1 hypothetical protein GGS22DRAFT_193357 [Annulohypoxylon maeteangense]